MIPWTDKEKKVLLKEDTSAKAIEKYYEAFPRSNRKKDNLYTYWWWRKQEEKKKFGGSLSKPVEKIVKESVNIVKKQIVDKVKKDLEQVHATIAEYNEIPNFEIGDSVRYARGSALLSPIGIVTNAEKKQGIPARSQKMKVRFDNYNVREVYCCDYIIVVKRK